MKTVPRTHFSVQKMNYYNEASEVAFDEYPAEIRHRMAVRVGRRAIEGVPLREWSLKFFDSSWYERPGGVWVGVRDRYRFEWDHRAVKLAERSTLVVPAQERAMESYLENMAVPEDTADLLHAELEMGQVNREDCEQLIANVAAYYGQEDMLQRRG